MGHTDLNEKDLALIIERLEEKGIPIEEVSTIYHTYREHKQIVGQVAMNLSLRTSVYERNKEYSPIMVDLLCDIATNPIDMGARWAVAKNPHTPPEVLKLLSKDEINLVRALVATNPNTPPEILEKFFSDEKIVRDGLSGNPSTPVKILKILSDDADKMVRLRLAENPATPKELLTKLALDEDGNVSKAAQIHLEKLVS